MFFVLESNTRCFAIVVVPVSKVFAKYFKRAQNLYINGLKFIWSLVYFFTCNSEILYLACIYYNYLARKYCHSIQFSSII